MAKGRIYLLITLLSVLLLSVFLISCTENTAPAAEIPGDNIAEADDLATKQAAQDKAQDAALSAFETTQAKASAEASGESTSVEKGAAILEASCTQCHSLDRVYAADYDAEGWKANIDRMVGNGAVISDEDASVLIEFLLAQQ